MQRDIDMVPGNRDPNRYAGKAILSAAVVALIAAGSRAIDILDQFTYEKEGARLVAYPDGEGNWTICKGLTRYQGKPVHKGLKLTADECRAADRAELEYDLASAREVLGEDVWARAPETLKAAVADMIHTLGKERVRQSLAVRELRAGRLNEGCAAMTLWIRDRGRDCRKAGSNCQGQPIRRMQEDALCLSAKEGSSL